LQPFPEASAHHKISEQPSFFNSTKFQLFKYGYQNDNHRQQIPATFIYYMAEQQNHEKEEKRDSYV